MMHDLLDPILSDSEYRAWVNLSAPTAQRQRSDGSGPPFVQLSDRRIGYRKSAVERWLQSRTIHRVGELASAKHTAEPAAKVTVTATADEAETGDANARAIGARASAEHTPEPAAKFTATVTAAEVETGARAEGGAA
jgi:predicted DNA-binding transcriptional regulator AlpA